MLFFGKQLTRKNVLQSCSVKKFALRDETNPNIEKNVKSLQHENPFDTFLHNRT